MRLSAGIILAACLVVVSTAPSSVSYTNKFDHIDIDAVLSNNRALNNYVLCMLDKGPCTAEGRELRARIPEALETNCEKCSDAQKNIVRKAVRHLIEKRPEDWKKIQNKFDAEGQYRDEFRRFVNAE